MPLPRGRRWGGGGEKRPGRAWAEFWIRLGRRSSELVLSESSESTRSARATRAVPDSDGPPSLGRHPILGRLGRLQGGDSDGCETATRTAARRRLGRLRDDGDSDGCETAATRTAARQRLGRLRGGDNDSDGCEATATRTAARRRLGRLRGGGGSDG